MDLNTIEAIGSLLGGVASVISLIGILFAVSEIRRARKQVDRETDYRIYEMMLDIDKFFIENSDLRPYLFDGKPMPDDVVEGSPEYHRVMAMIEMMLDFMECAYTQLDLMPVYQRIGWIDYFTETSKNSPLIRQFVEHECEWYMPSFVRLLTTSEFDPRLDKWDANAEWRRINKAHWRNRLRERFARREADRPRK
jgi:hypothetical protein